jgi:hypothetical protein
MRTIEYKEWLIKSRKTKQRSTLLEDFRHFNGVMVEKTNG